MANESLWEVVPSSFETTDPVPRPITNSNTDDAKGDTSTSIYDQTLPKEAKGVQLGSQYLYALKEHLVRAGWTVVSSSYRLSSQYRYTDGATDYDGYWKRNVNNEISAGTINGDLTNFTSGKTVYDLNHFTSISGDGWLPSKGRDAASNIFYWSTDSGYNSSNPAWSVIYPDYCPVVQRKTSYTKRVISNNTYHDALTIDNANRKGLLSEIYYYNGTGQPSGCYYTIGRSWILLKAPDNFAEPSEASYPEEEKKNYHILLDYVDDDSPAYIGASTATTFLDFIPNSTTVGYEPTKRFGGQMNVLIFPDYTPGDSATNRSPWDLNTTYVPKPWIRPSHLSEIGCTVRVVGTNGDTTYGSKYLDFIDNYENYYFINTLYAPPSEANGATILLGSSNGTPMFSIVLGSIADKIDDSILQRNSGKNGLYSGSKYFMFWSNLTRKTLTADPPKQINKIIPNLSTTLTIGDIRNTIFDAQEKNGSIYYYNIYSPRILSGTKFEYRIINSCIPAFYAQTTSTANGACLLLANKPYAGATSDYTYVEWPLPLMYVQGNSKNFNYVGRMMDIKLGPAAAPNGILARESGSANYDRLFMNGLWFPYSGSSGILF